MTVASPPRMTDAGAARRRLLWPAGRVALNVLLLAGLVALVVWLAGRLQVVVVPVLVSLLIATLLVPPVDALRRRGLPSVLATVAVMLALAGVVAVLVGFVIPGIVDQLHQLGATSGTAWTRCSGG